MLIFKNKMTIVFIVIMLLFITVIYLFNGKFDSNMRQKADYATLEITKTGIEKYVEQSVDVYLTLGDSTPLSVDKILLKLQQRILFNSQSYGPYIEPLSAPPVPSDYYPSYNRKYKGWEIVINRRTKGVRIKPVSEGNIIKHE